MSAKVSINNPYLMLLLGLILIMGTAKVWDRIQLPPASVHQWRQSDCAAYAKTFYRNGTGIFTPGTFNLAGNQGRVASEFPVIYYLAAQIEHLTGEHYWVVRGLTLLCYLTGMFALLAIVRRYITDGYYALFSVVILASTPYFYYYAVNFLPNVPAISFSFVGLFFFLRYDSSGKTGNLFAGTLFFILSTALKPTDGGILWLAYLCTRFCQAVIIKKKKINFWPTALSALLVAVSIYGWTKYVNWYNDLNGNHQNLLGIYPFWEMDSGLFKYTTKRVITEWSNVFQQKYILFFLAGMLLLYVIKWRSLDQFLRLLTLFLFLGTAGYSVLWYKAYNDHDYYQLVFVLPAVFLSITVMEFYARVWAPAAGRKVRPAIGVVLAAVVLVSIYHNRNIQQERYTDPVHIAINPAMYHVEPYLEKLGIKENDVVVCVPDKSPNISLNAINRYGYSEEFNSDVYNINLFREKGASYLIISDSSYLDNPLYKPHTQKKLGQFEGIYVFDLR